MILDGDGSVAEDQCGDSATAAIRPGGSPDGDEWRVEETARESTGFRDVGALAPGWE